MLRLPILLLTLLTIPLWSIAQSPPIYSKVELKLQGDNILQELNEAGIAIDHIHKNKNNTIDFILNEEELALLKNTGYSYEVRIPDMNAYYEQQRKNSGPAEFDACGLENYTEGSMGGYHTYDEIVSTIQLMMTEYPEIAQVSKIGESLEGRDVFSVKISDNVAQDESSEEGVVYFDALIHAREPLSMESLLYYMWYLLENYEQEEEITHLVNNRELFFVPIVNPDGYVYNQSTNPDGGGLWRKNRRINAGSNCVGVDLNRNYSFKWGNPAGSSGDPCSETYRGTQAFSEIESQNVRDFVLQINPAIAFSCHSRGNLFIHSNDFGGLQLPLTKYLDYASEFTPRDYSGYGTTEDMLNYSVSGTTGEYLHSLGTHAWVFEIGSTFWDPADQICFQVGRIMPTYKYLTWVSGNYLSLQDYRLTSEQQLWEGNELEMLVRLRNKGLRTAINEAKLIATCPLPEVSPIQTEISFGVLAPGEMKENTTLPIRFSIEQEIALGTEIPIALELWQDGRLMDTVQTYFYAGRRVPLFSEDAEMGIGQWESSGTHWDSTSYSAFGGEHCITDTPEASYLRQHENTFTLSNPIDLSGATQPFLEFNAKWAMEQDYDYVRLEASTDGSSWKALSGKYTEVLPADNLPAYFNHQYWVSERIDLSEYAGEANFTLRFRLKSDSGIQSDGFYFDDFQVVDYQEGINVGTTVPHALTSSLAAFPNPNTGSTTLQLEATRSEFAQISIRDLSGKLLLQQRWNLEAGSNHYPLSFPNSGVYLVKVERVHGVEVMKVVCDKQ